jgi:hypothetical protein
MKKVIIIALIFSTLLLSSCLWAFSEIMCDLWWGGDSDHCYQAAAIQEADQEWCDKIEWADFAPMWSNPPKDKCHTLIAENTGDVWACDNIEWWYASYTREDCIFNTSVKHADPSWCMKLEWVQKTQCIERVGLNLSPWDALEMDRAIEDLKDELKKWEDPDLQEQLAWLEQRKQDYVDALPPDKKDQYDNYSNPLNKKIRDELYGEKNRKTRESLIALSEAARKRGETIPDQEYETIKNTLIWKNDPKNDIEQMDDDEIVKLSLVEKAWKLKDKLKFWKANDTPKEKKLDESLRFYQKMLERQAAIDKWRTQQQQEFDKYFDAAKKESKDYVTWKINDELKNAGIWDFFDGNSTANIATSVVWEALDVVLEEWQSSEFRWLVNAYNDGMIEELGNYKWDIEKAHEAVVNNLKADAYRYENYDNGATFSKYGNLMANQECWPKNSNPLCLNKDIFFKAMKKSYKYQNTKK